MYIFKLLYNPNSTVDLFQCLGYSGLNLCISTLSAALIKSFGQAASKFGPVTESGIIELPQKSPPPAIGRVGSLPPYLRLGSLVHPFCIHC